MIKVCTHNALNLYTQSDELRLIFLKVFSFREVNHDLKICKSFISHFHYDEDEHHDDVAQKRYIWS